MDTNTTHDGRYAVARPPQSHSHPIMSTRGVTGLESIPHRATQRDGPDRRRDLPASMKSLHSRTPIARLGIAVRRSYSRMNETFTLALMLIVPGAKVATVPSPGASPAVTVAWKFPLVRLLYALRS